MFSANEKSAPATAPVADLREAPCAPAAPEVPKPAAQRAPRRRFRSGDVTAHINMHMVGEVCIGVNHVHVDIGSADVVPVGRRVCIGVNLQGYRSLLQGYFSDESGSLDALLQALQEGEPESLRAAAHGFKGASANLGFQKLADLAFELEKHEENGRSFREAHTQLLAAWEMTHALCLRMGLTDVETALDRHRNTTALSEYLPELLADFL
eukprot:gene12003-15265_t